MSLVCKVKGIFKYLDKTVGGPYEATLTVLLIMLVLLPPLVPVVVVVDRHSRLHA